MIEATVIQGEMNWIFSHAHAIVKCVFLKQICGIKLITVAMTTQTQTTNTMKKLITMAVAILITACIAAFAAGKTPVSMPQKQFDYQISFSKIVVTDDINLQLKESDSKIIDVAGNDADVENVDWKIKDDVLYLSSKNKSLKDKVTVNINVSHLKEIAILGESVVSSAGTLRSPRLSVFMQGNCYVTIKNAGQINVFNDTDTELDIKRMVGDVYIGR